jgi:UrcA family protein
VSKKSISAVLLIAGAALVAGPSFADELTVTAGSKSAPVSYSDLNVRTAEGAHELIARVETAADRLCKAQASASTDYDTCMLIAVDNAMAQVGEPLYADASDAEMRVARVGD